MTNINKILSRRHNASNYNTTGVRQAEVLSARYRVRVDPERDLFCVVDRKHLVEQYGFWEEIMATTWYGSIVKIRYKGLYWPSFDDALAFAKLLDKAQSKALTKDQLFQEIYASLPGSMWAKTDDATIRFIVDIIHAVLPSETAKDQEIKRLRDELGERINDLTTGIS